MAFRHRDAEARDEASTVAQRLNLALKASRAGVFEYDYKKQAYWLSSEFAALVGPDAAELGSRLEAVSRSIHTDEAFVVLDELRDLRPVDGAPGYLEPLI